jgi:dipeptidyl-peptidase-4
VKRVATGSLFLTVLLAVPAAQDRLRLMPGYEQHANMQSQLQTAFVSGAAQGVQWADDSRSFRYTVGSTSYRFDLNQMKRHEGGSKGSGRTGAHDGSGHEGGTAPPRGGLEQAQSEMPATPMRGCPRTRTPRGRQDECEMSPDGRLKAFYRARNFWIGNADGSGEVQVTTDGSEARRIKNGSGSWVYGEELDQTTAMWWSPDSRRVAYYRFDESQVRDFYVQMNQTGIQSVMDVEAYPKAGAPNPIAEVFVYDVGARTSTKIDVRDGRPFDNDVVGHYVYNVRWSPDGAELLLNRTNRRQNVMELAACSPASGRCRAAIREEWSTGWTENRPEMTWLKDQKRFIWKSERTGWANYYLYDISGRLINPITTHDAFEAGAIVKVDETTGVLFYMARSGGNSMKSQLHRVGLDGRGDVRLTDPDWHHNVQISPDNRYFVDTYQTHDVPPATQLVAMPQPALASPGGSAASGHVAVVAQVSQTDVSKLDALGVRRAEQFTYLAGDGKTRLYGQILFPSTFDPAKKWPALVAVYGGPGSASNVPSEAFAPPSATAEYGFLIVTLTSRAAPGLGKRTLDAIYRKLGTTEVDDMAAGIRELSSRPYVDKDRVGIYGTSYGGYVSLLMLLKHPDLVVAASASSPVTSWYHYDSIYTERYMWLPQENKDGYEAGSAMNVARHLRGRLLVFYGTADNNVHPNNSMQLIQAMQNAGKSFEVQVGPDAGHSSVNRERMMEFFIENLVLRPERALGR